MQTTSEFTAELDAALSLAQSEMDKATKSNINPHFRSRYASLSDVIDASMPSMTKHGLSMRQTTDVIEGQLFLITRLSHKSGQWVDSKFPVVADLSKPQSLGSTLTYLKRYAWSSMVGVAFCEEDDDANSSEPKKVVVVASPSTTNSPPNKINQDQLKLLLSEIQERDDLHDAIIKFNKIQKLDDLTSDKFDRVISYVRQNKNKG